jgi:hypothetical protein
MEKRGKTCYLVACRFRVADHHERSAETATTMYVGAASSLVEGEGRRRLMEPLHGATHHLLRTSCVSKEAREVRGTGRG